MLLNVVKSKKHDISILNRKEIIILERIKLELWKIKDKNISVPGYESSLLCSYLSEIITKITQIGIIANMIHFLNYLDNYLGNKI